MDLADQLPRYEIPREHVEHVYADEAARYAGDAPVKSDDEQDRNGAQGFDVSSNGRGAVRGGTNISAPCPVPAVHGFFNHPLMERIAETSGRAPI